MPPLVLSHRIGVAVAEIDTSGWVYVLDDLQGHYKIGKGKDLNRRVKQLRIQLPYPVALHYAFQTPNCHADEKTLHEQFKDKRLNGEWFGLELDDLGAIYDFANYEGLYEWCGKLVRDPMFNPLALSRPNDDDRYAEAWDEDDYFILVEIASLQDELNYRHFYGPQEAGDYQYCLVAESCNNDQGASGQIPNEVCFA